MKVVILCGGLGTRMREETEFRPKPLVDIGGRPILWHIMKLYAHYGFRNFVLCLGYRGSMIKEYFLNYEAMNNDFTICLGQSHELSYHGAHAEQGYAVTLADTGSHTMTGGRLRRIRKYISDREFLVSYGDGLADIDIGAVVEFHRSHGKLATVTTVRPRSRFGILGLNDSNEVVNFSEKPLEQGWVNAGFFVFNREVFDLFPDDDCRLEREPLETLANDRQLIAYRHSGFFYAMDTYREYQQLNDMWATGNAPWRVWP
jgi:glucose-1-phosphate cytidylyltransferase